MRCAGRPPRLSATRASRFAVLVLAGGLLSACVTEPAPRRLPPPPPPIDTTVYAYPVHGQTAQQQDRDHYECYVWAKEQTGFDPSAPNVPPQARVRVAEGPPPGTGTAVGAVTGAVIGAAISNPWDRGFGAIAGALIGGAIGSSAEAAGAERSHEAAAVDRAQMRRIEHEAADYRRALSACLEGRGYSVH
jgi:hypothetical protein